MNTNAPRVLIVAAMIFSAAAPAYADMKCPRGWARFSEDHRVGQPYFECEYTTDMRARVHSRKRAYVRTLGGRPPNRHWTLFLQRLEKQRLQGVVKNVHFDRGEIVLDQQSAVRQTTRRRLPRARCEGER
jgi:hypothetical protein